MLIQLLRMSITQIRALMGRLKQMWFHSQITVQRYLGSRRTSMVVQEVSVTFFPWGTLL
ncbi:hypothetical protein SynBIOSE41_04071 [Synechococcus sp. BIOS-E4-1]|nr:hypothetical protein SynBIOSE41_04071 [Synechococcus sp. BIOS-E4-1]